MSDDTPRLAQTTDPVVRALKRLTNEIAGVWDAFEHGIRQEISNTNYAVVREKITEAESVLAALAPGNAGAPKPGDLASRGAIAQSILDGDYEGKDSFGLADIMLEHWDVRWKEPGNAGPITTEQLDQLQFGRSLHERPGNAGAVEDAAYWKERHDLVLRKHMECCGQAVKRCTCPHPDLCMEYGTGDKS